MLSKRIFGIALLLGTIASAAGAAEIELISRAPLRLAPDTAAGGFLLLHGWNIALSLTLSDALARFPCCRAQQEGHRARQYIMGA